MFTITTKVILVSAMLLNVEAPIVAIKSYKPSLKFVVIALKGVDWLQSLKIYLRYPQKNYKKFDNIGL